MLNFLFLHCKG